MKPSEIIYHNEFSGLTELCSHKDIDRCHETGLPKELQEKYPQTLFPASYVGKSFYLDGEFRFNSYDRDYGVYEVKTLKKINMQDFITGDSKRAKVTEIPMGIDMEKPKMSQGKKIYEAVFTLEEKKSNLLTVRLDEMQSDGSYKFIGRIKFINQPSIEINGIKGNAVIKILDVKPNWNYETNYLLGNFALGVGLYFFVDLDGKWSELNNTTSFVDVAQNEHTKQIKDEIHKSNDDLKQIITESTSELKTGQKEILDGIGEIKESIEVIQRSLDNISSAMKVYKEDVVEKLEEAFEENDKELLREEFSDQLTRKIVSVMSKQSGIQNYSNEEAKLKAVFGDSWHKLNEKSQEFLITAQILFSQMSMTEKSLDYSGVCILVTKALEVEMKRRLYFDFLSYLKFRYSDHLDQWHYALRKKNPHKKDDYVPLEEQKFTLGTVAQVCCLHKSSSVDEHAFEISKQRICEFARDKLFLDDKNDVFRLIKNVGREVNHIKERYRNPAAHVNNIGRVDAKACLDEVLYVQKVLVNILNLMKY